MAQEIQLELWPTSMVFFEGHRLRLEVSSSNFPRFDINPNTGVGSTLERTLSPPLRRFGMGLTTLPGWSCLSFLVHRNSTATSRHDHCNERSRVVASSCTSEA